jgi:hypothetical protein
MTDFEQACLDKLDKLDRILERINVALEAYAQQPERRTAYLTDEECLKKLEDTGFIMINPRIKDKVSYLIKKGHNVLDTFGELAKMTGSELRARAIMIQNMTKVEGTLNNNRPKHSLKN